MYQSIKSICCLVVCVLWLAQTPAVQANSEAASPVHLMSANRTVSISKSSSPTAAQAQLAAEKKNPGWKVVNIKELSKSWSITMKKE